MNRDTQIFCLAYRIAESKYNHGVVASHAEIMEEAKAIEGLGSAMRSYELERFNNPPPLAELVRVSDLIRGHTIRASDITI